jgi:hypothetical protein
MLLPVLSLAAADGNGEFVLDALTWPAPCTIATSGLWYDVDNEDEPESMDAYLLAVTWQAWAGEAAAAPSGLEARLTSYVTLQVRVAARARRFVGVLMSV